MSFWRVCAADLRLLRQAEVWKPWRYNDVPAPLPTTPLDGLLGNYAAGACMADVSAQTLKIEPRVLHIKAYGKRGISAPTHYLLSPCPKCVPKQPPCRLALPPQESLKQLIGSMQEEARQLTHRAHKLEQQSFSKQEAQHLFK